MVYIFFASRLRKKRFSFWTRNELGIFDIFPFRDDSDLMHWFLGNSNAGWSAEQVILQQARKRQTERLAW